MTEQELEAFDIDAMALISRANKAGIVCAFVREHEGGEELRLICPQTLLVRPLLKRAADYLHEQETEN